MEIIKFDENSSVLFSYVSQLKHSEALNADGGSE